MKLITTGIVLILGLVIIDLWNGGLFLDLVLRGLRRKGFVKWYVSWVDPPTDDFSGKEAEVCSPFLSSGSETSSGKVFFNGSLWAATGNPSDMGALVKGDRVRIIKREGLILVVDSKLSGSTIGASGLRRAFDRAHAEGSAESRKGREE